MVDIPGMISLNQKRWERMNIRPNRLHEFERVADLLLPHMNTRFKTVEDFLLTKGFYVPRWAVAVIGVREAGEPPQLFRGQLGQGDPLGEVSRHEPAGRGPFFGADAWERSCYDSLIDCAPHAAKWKDWTPGGAATIFIMYNGLAYDRQGRPSPYAWSGTDQYDRGKVMRDHGPIEDVVDVQLGCMGLVKMLMDKDPSLHFGFPATAGHVEPKTAEHYKSFIDLFKEAFERL